MDAVIDVCQPARQWMPKIVVGKVEKVCLPVVAGAGARVHRDAKPLSGAFEKNVVMGAVSKRFRFAVQHPAAEKTVAPRSQAISSNASNDGRANIRAAVIVP
jgi:hypothetical protein